MVEDSAFEYRVDQRRPLRCLTEHLPFLLVAIAGYQSSGDKFGETGDAGLRVGRHGAGTGADCHEAPHSPIDDDRHTHRRSDSHLTDPCGHRTGDVFVGVDPRGAAGSLYHRRKGVALSRSSSA